MISSVFKDSIKRVLLIYVLCFTSHVFEANALITKSKANAEKTAAVNEEKRKAREQLDAISKERDAIKKSTEAEAKKLNDTITSLQKDISQKEKEKTDLNEKIEAAEASRKAYETKTTKEKADVQAKFEAEKKRLNQTITQKTTQLTQRIAELKKVTQAGKNLEESYRGAEASYLVNEEVLRDEISGLKAELKSLLDRAKQFETETKDREKTLLKNAEIERRNLTDIIMKNQEIEIRMLVEISQLKSKLDDLVQEQQKIINDGRLLEEKLNAKINELTEKIKQYSSIIESTRETELRQLSVIDSLRTQFNDAIVTNKELIKKGKEVSRDNSAIRGKNKAMQERLENTWQKDEKYFSSQEVARIFGGAKDNKGTSFAGEQQTYSSPEQTGLMATGNRRVGNPQMSSTDNGIQTQSPQVPRQQFDNKAGVSLEQAELITSGNRHVSIPQEASANKDPRTQSPQVPRQQFDNEADASLEQAELMNSGNRHVINPQDGSTNKEPQMQSSQEQNQQFDNAQIIKQLQATSKTTPQSKEDELVNFVVETILAAISKTTDNNMEKINTAMNLIGAGAELPEILNAILEVTREQYDPQILTKAIKEINRRYRQRDSFVDESLKHLYGKDGEKLIYWNK